MADPPVALYNIFHIQDVGYILLNKLVYIILLNILYKAMQERLRGVYTLQKNDPQKTTNIQNRRTARRKRWTKNIEVVKSGNKCM